MIEKEIKKLASAYAEAMCPAADYEESNNPDDARSCDIQIRRGEAESVLRWLFTAYPDFTSKPRRNDMEKMKKRRSEA